MQLNSDVAPPAVGVPSAAAIQPDVDVAARQPEAAAENAAARQEMTLSGGASGLDTRTLANELQALSLLGGGGDSGGAGGAAGGAASATPPHFPLTRPGAAQPVEQTHLLTHDTFAVMLSSITPGRSPGGSGANSGALGANSELAQAVSGSGPNTQLLEHHMTLGSASTSALGGASSGLVGSVGGSTVMHLAAGAGGYLIPVQHLSGPLPASTVTLTATNTSVPVYAQWLPNSSQSSCGSLASSSSAALLASHRMRGAAMPAGAPGSALQPMLTVPGPLERISGASSGGRGMPPRAGGGMPRGPRAQVGRSDSHALFL